MRRFGLVLTFLVLATAAAAPAEAASPLVRRSVPGLSFSVSVPRTWRSIDYRQVATTDVLDQLVRENPRLAQLVDALRSPNTGVKLFAFDPKATGGFATNMNLVVSSVPAGTTASAYVASAVVQLGALPNVIKPIRREAVRLPAGSAIHVRFGIRFTLGGKQVVTSTTQYVLVRGATAYVVTYTTLPSRSARQAPLFAASAKSIRIVS